MVKDADRGRRLHNGNNPSATETGYNALTKRTAADDLGNPWGTSPYQRTFAWPAAKQLLPDVEDKHVLLAGCGRGDHAEWFLNRKSTVVGIDIAGDAIEIARDRYGDNATFRQGALTEASELLTADADLILSHLVLSHIESWPPVFTALREVAADGATLVVTTVHPQYLAEIGDVQQYAEPAGFTADWGTADLPTYYRPISTAIESIATTGWRINAVREPEPRETFCKYAPDRYAAALERPELLTLRARAD